MASNPGLGIAFAFVCLGILGVMPVLADARPAAFDGLTFTIWLTFWQLVSALPLFVREQIGGRRGFFNTGIAPQRRTRTMVVALVTGAIFGISTYMFVVAADKAGPVSMAIALQAYPLFAILIEAVFLGKRKTPAELAFTAVLIAALVYLTTNGTFRPADISWWSVYALGIPLLWSIAHIMLRQVLASTSVTPNQVTVTRLVISGVFLLALAAAFGEPGALLRGMSDFGFQKAAIALGLAYYLELLFWFHALRHIDVSVASSVTVPTPAVTMLIAIVFTGAHVELYQVLAMVVIAAAMYGLLLAGRRARLAGAT
jgi:drug/metabolite transporter (DMT)-like permease